MDGYVVIGTDLDTKSFDRQIYYIEKQLEEIEDKLKQADMGLEVGDIDKLEANYEKLSQQLTKLRQKQADLNKTDLSQAENAMKNISSSTESVIKKVGRWALAVFSVRSAYALISRTSSTLAQYNDQYATNLEYLRYVLAQALAPVLQFLVNLAYKLLTYVNYIAQAWFGVNLFSNASSKNFNKMAGSAEKIRKSLQATAFDEMNVLSDTSSSSGGAGVTMPSVDLSKQDIPIPKWLQWIADNKDVILGFFKTLALVIAGIKIADLLNGLGLLGKGISNIGVIIRGLGIGLALYGAIELVKDLIDLIKNPSWEKFSEVLADISFILAGIGLVVGGPTGIKMAILGAILTIVGAVIQNWDTIKETLDKILPFINDHILQPILITFKKFIDTGIMIFSTGLSIMKGIAEIIMGVIEGTIYTAFLFIQDQFEAIKRILNGFKEVFVGLFTGDLKRALNGFKEIFAGVCDSLWGIAKVPLNLIITAINSLIKGINKFSIKVPSWVPEIGGRNFGFNIPTIKYLKTGGIINLPNRGVPVGTSAFGGEAGAEGVIPLTDSQAMETLGEAIGRYITINANITNSMNGRVISRELQKIQSSNNFAYNS